MSQIRHSPYGADDDPFLTPPAGPGSLRSRSAAQYWDGDDLPYPQGRQGPDDQAWPDAPMGRGGARGGYAPPAAPQAAAYGGERPESGQPAMFMRHKSAPYAPEGLGGGQARPIAGYSAPGAPRTPYANPDYYSPDHEAQAYWQHLQWGQNWGQDQAGFLPEAPLAGHRPYPDAAASAYAPEQGGYEGGYGAGARGAGPSAHWAAPEPSPMPRMATHHGGGGQMQAPAYPPAAAQGFDGYDPAAYYGQDHADSRYAERQENGHQLGAGLGAGRGRLHVSVPSAPVIAARMSAQMAQWAGAACTVLAVLGAGYWGYDLALRDAQGIPVVRATLGPLRVAPQEPGGEVSANQGLAVNSVPAMAASEAPPQEVVLAPQTGDLAPADTGQASQLASADLGQVQDRAAGKWLTPEPAATLPAQSAWPEAQAQTDLYALADSVPEDLPLSDAEAVERALAAALAEGGETPQDALASAPEDAAQSALAAEQGLANGGDVSMADVNPILPPMAEIDPATIAAGTPLVQFGAFDSPETARSEWLNLQARFAELMVGKSLVVEAAKSGGRDFYRLRAHGFASADDTRRFCAAILAENGTCLTVDQR